MTFIVTPAHQAIFDAIHDPAGGNLIISAVAGSGKTSTIVEAIKLIPASTDTVFLAFGNKIAAHLSRILPSHVPAMTLHSLGNRALMEHLRERHGIRGHVDQNKLRDIGKDLYQDEWQFIAGKVNKLVKLAKSSGVGTSICPDTYAVWQQLADKHDVFDAEERGVERMIEAARAVLTKSMTTLERIDFDDMLLMAFHLNAQLPTFDWVFVDEAQDLSPLQHELVARCIRPVTGRIVAVGDPHQSIFGFRGADSSSMETLRQRFHMRELPLHVSYRCAKSVVAIAQEYVGHIQPHADAPEGTVIREAKPIPESGLRVGDMLVCRFTAPMVKAAFSLIAAGTPAAILGRDIGSNLLTMLRKMKPDSLADAEVKVGDWERKELEKAIRKGDEMKQEAISDKAEVLRSFIDASSSVDDMLARIEAMFSDDDEKTRVTCCTVHKSKGLESDRVFVINAHKMPSKWAKQDWQKEQENNLIYVAFTRAKLHLQFVLVGEERTKGAGGPAPATRSAGAPVAVTGNTYPVKDKLKALGARWDGTSKVWLISPDKLAEAQKLVGGSTRSSPSDALRRAAAHRPRPFRPCGYPGCSPQFCDECDGRGR